MNGTTSVPVVYAGRYADKVFAAELAGCEILSEWDVLPLGLSAALERAGVLILLDLFSFPYETLSWSQWEVPIFAVLPTGLNKEFLHAVFGEPLFERLGFFDRIVTADDSLWAELARSYRWTQNQRLVPENGSPDGVVAGILARLEEESVPDAPVGDIKEEDFDALRYWRERGDIFAEAVPHRAVCSPHHGLQFNKALHRAQMSLLEPQFDAARGERTDEVPFDVLEVGCGVGRWAASLDPASTRFTGVDVSAAMVSAARENFPEGSFETLGDDFVLPFDDEKFDLCFTATILHHNDTDAKRRLISEMWRVARPGGRLMFLEDFVFGRSGKGSVVYPMSVSEFMDLLWEESRGEIVLEHVESLRYPQDDLVRAALISVSKIGVPRRW